MKTVYGVGLVLLALVTGCAGRQAAWEGKAEQAAVVDEAAVAKAAELAAQGDEAWKTRGDVEKLKEALAKWEEASKTAPNMDTYVKLSRGYYFYAESAFSLDKSKQAEMLATYDLGTKAGEQAVAASSPDFVKAVKGGAKWEEAVKSTDEKSVPALYWYASNLGKWARAQGFTVVLSNRDRIKATMTQCLRANPDYFYAAPHRYFGAYYSVAPAFAGGDVDKSKSHFEESLTRAPSYLATKVLMADVYATKKQDRALFEKLLKEVVAADATTDPEIIPEQELEKKKAEDLLKRAEDLF
jgi:hypothetical protein